MLSRRSMLGLCGAAPLWAAPQADFSVDVKVVNMVATVRDKSGRLITDLTQDDFTVEEEGHPQPITYFLVRNELPLTLGLLVDTSFSQKNVLEQERTASLVFLQRILRDIDRAFLANFDARLKMYQEPTSSRVQLEDGLRQMLLDVSKRPPEYGTVLFDALYQSSQVVMKRIQGRHAVILLTDGVESSSTRTEAAAIEASLRTETAVYSVCISDESAYGNQGFGGGRRGPMAQPLYSADEGKATLKHLSEKTGGGYFVVSPLQSLDEIFKQISDELRSQYNIGYAAPGGKPGFRKVRLKVKKPGFSAQTREGYYSGS